VLSELQIVMDTSVLIAALRSNRGASFALLSQIGTSDRFAINLSVPLVLEYEGVAKRPGMVPGLSPADIDDVLDYLCLVGRHRDIYYLWRPVLPDPGDDMILELAVESECDFIVTHNISHFRRCEEFDPKAVTPAEFFRGLEAIP
jgi:predicted nucleic acid-binding protein